MCYRFYLKTSDLNKAQRQLKAKGKLSQKDRFNIAPSKEIAALRAMLEGGERESVLLHWGLVPSWAKDPAQFGTQLANARAETVAEKPSFRQAFSRRRCIVPASGFFEWETLTNGKKQPWVFESRAEELPFLIAGLWETWVGPDEKTLETCTLLTTTPNELVAKLHDRMPVIFDAAQAELWLSPNETRFEPEWHNLLGASLAAERMLSRRVDPYVSNVRHDDERCIQTYATPPEPEADQLSLGL